MVELDGAALWVTDDAPGHRLRPRSAARQVAALAGLLHRRHGDRRARRVTSTPTPTPPEPKPVRERFTRRLGAGRRARRPGGRLAVLAPRRRHAPGRLAAPADRPGVGLPRHHRGRRPPAGRRGRHRPPAAGGRPPRALGRLRTCCPHRSHARGRAPAAGRSIPATDRGRSAPAGPQAGRRARPRGRRAVVRAAPGGRTRAPPPSRSARRPDGAPEAPHPTATSSSSTADKHAETDRGARHLLLDGERRGRTAPARRARSST